MATKTNWQLMVATDGKTLVELRNKILEQTGVKIWVSRFFTSAVYDSKLIESLMEQLAQSVSADVNNVTKTKPDWGYWDGRHDFRTEMDTLYGIELATRTQFGILKLMLRHNATNICPSGPCGLQEERILWLDVPPTQ